MCEVQNLFFFKLCTEKLSVYFTLSVKLKPQIILDHIAFQKIVFVQWIKITYKKYINNNYIDKTNSSSLTNVK